MKIFLKLFLFFFYHSSRPWPNMTNIPYCKDVCFCSVFFYSKMPSSYCKHKQDLPLYLCAWDFQRAVQNEFVMNVVSIHCSDSKGKTWLLCEISVGRFQWIMLIFYSLSKYSIAFFSLQLFFWNLHRCVRYDLCAMHPLWNTALVFLFCFLFLWEARVFL